MSDNIIGPTLPPNWGSQATADGDGNDDEDDNEVFGPTLPPDYGCDALKSDTNCIVIGPTLPSGFGTDGPKGYSKDTIDTKRKVIGPTLPPHLMPSTAAVDDSDSDSDSDEVIGPILPTDDNYDKMNAKFGMSSQILAKIEAKNELKKEREEWMMTAAPHSAPKIPTKSVTHFSQRPVKSLDTNRDKYHKKDEKKERELDLIMDSFNKSQKRDHSLIDQHRKEAKKAKKSEPKVEERAEFDREKDLSVRTMSSTQRRSVLNKAQEFNDRFSKGVNKFL